MASSEVDSHGRVRGLDDVYAAGDMTTRPLKQGGLATQQADAAAAAIAAAAGADVEARWLPARCCARCCSPAAGRATCATRRTTAGALTDEAPWWPPHKIAGRELAPYLTAHPELRLEPMTTRRGGIRMPLHRMTTRFASSSPEAASPPSRPCSRCTPSPGTE